MSPIILYNHDASPPCCLVRLVAGVIGVDLKKVDVRDIENGMKNPEMIKKNPQHTVPTIDDNGLVIAESRAIAMYLVSKYAKTDSLYPTDLQKRVLVDQRLFFDQDLYNRILAVCAPLFYGKPVPQSDADKMKGGLDTLSRMLDGKQWLAGDNVTLADYAVAVSLATLEYNTEFAIDAAKHPNITQWISRLEESSPMYREHIEQFFETVRKTAEEEKKKAQQK
ncbi:glutathione S-transferase D7-like [Schistocerca gregaria]|uniref:glutathione S-transferase D7-like n=1 Tax=Schistocerca gregaria TaxID=7010 RepID=UPI00211F0872|nr:glutathione S-transferase D7-like [Schistocerca gregaria]XP_049856958.1 glutathione S-transferase D7-like [Schistocerca gregaria]